MSYSLILLAAGQGKRLGEDLPKSLSAIGDRTYLDYQMDSLKKFSELKAHLVTGFAADVLQTFVQKNYPRFFFVHHNADFKRGNILSLTAALPHVQGGFFIFNADHCYSPETYAKIFSFATQETPCVFIDQDRSLTDDDMKVAVQNFNETSFVKTMSKKLASWDAGYVGVTWIPENFRKRYEIFVADLLAEQGPDANVESVVNLAASRGDKIHCIDISGSWWTEVDTPEDLAKAKQILFSARSLPSR